MRAELVEKTGDATLSALGSSCNPLKRQRTSTNTHLQSPHGGSLTLWVYQLLILRIDDKSHFKAHSAHAAERRMFCAVYVVLEMAARRSHFIGLDGCGAERGVIYWQTY